MRRVLFAAAIVVLVTCGRVSAQAHRLPTDSAPSQAQPLEAIVVTATRTPTRLLDAAVPASVLTRQQLYRRPHESVISFFTGIPGLDVTGVGPNQLRPVIRGFGGQRILLLEDGLRVNNARRQQDFGELPALVNQQALDRVEVLRGPASVLYGSDAIGGVVNLIGASLPAQAGGDVVHGAVRFRYVGGAAGTTQPSGTITMRTGRLAVLVDASHRDAEPYEAPAGTFGTLVLDRPAVVRGSGVRDRSIGARVELDVDSRHQLFLRYSGYRATEAGFGFIEPSRLGPDATLVDIRYPDQRVDRGTIGYRGRDLGLVIADRLAISAYASGNGRKLDQSIFAPFGPGTPPGAGISIETRNVTDVHAAGGRVEAARSLGSRHVVTWGIDLARDRATGTDSSSSQVFGFGPSSPRTSNRPALPDAEFRTVGVFAQDAIAVAPRLSAVIGVRFQSNTAETFATEGLTEPPVQGTDQTTVWAVNLLYHLSDDVRLVAASSRGFRSPNLVERFYNGVTPEGGGFQARNPDLKAESGVEVDFGIRIQRPTWSFDGFVFQNDLRDGIRISATGDSTMGFAAFRNVNVDRLRVRGVELSSTWQPFRGATVHAGYSLVDETDVAEPATPIGDAAGTKVVLGAGYQLRSGRAWGGVRLRHQGARDTALGRASLVGPNLPAFTVVDIDVGAIPFSIGRFAQVVTARVENVGNALYAESANASFFRPAPGRRLQLMLSTEF